MIDGQYDLKNSGRVILTSSSENESSWPIYIPKQWLFPYYLFKGFQSNFADINDNSISENETLLEAYQYAKSRTIFRSSILATLFSFIPFIPHDFVPQHPQLYDGWPSFDNNSIELQLIYQG